MNQKSLNGFLSTCCELFIYVFIYNKRDRRGAKEMWKLYLNYIGTPISTVPKHSPFPNILSNREVENN